MWFLRQSTASQEVMLGPFLDSTDGNTAETALSIANTDIKLFVTGATSEASKNSGGATHIAAGRYYTVLDATDTATIGPMRVSCHVAGALAVWLDCCVLAANVYDVMFGTTAPSTYAGGDTAGTTTLLGRVTGAVLLAANYTAPANADIAAIKAKTDNLPSDPADQSLIIAATDAIMGRLGTPAVTIAADIATRLPTISYTAPPSADTVASAVRTELATELGRIDVAVGTRQATFTAATTISFPANFAALAITAAGKVTVGANDDKAGYSLAADQPVNVTKINGVTLTGAGTSGNPMRPA